MKNFPAFPPVVYHGTLLQHYNSIREQILIDRVNAKQFLDFGKGFYTTTNLEQANERAWKLQEDERDARTGFLQRKHRGVVIAFDFLPAALYTIPKEQCRWFSSADREWAEFIVKNRVQQTPPYAHGCLWTYGPMADGRTNLMCYAYFDGEIDMEMLLNGFTDSRGIHAGGIRPYQDAYDQLAFHSETGELCFGPRKDRTIRKPIKTSNQTQAVNQMSTPTWIDFDLRFLREVHQELKNLYSLTDALADQLIQNSILPQRLATDPEHVHHDAPIYWAHFIGRKNNLQAEKPL